MKKNAFWVVIMMAVIIVALLVILFFVPGSTRDREIVACTMEAKLCPDGSAVGRIGPDCEFAMCPELGREAKENIVSNYIRENISALSSEPEVLGGIFYVTNVEFTGENSGVVEYEDGHIALVVDFEYMVNEDGNAEVVFLNTRDF